MAFYKHPTLDGDGVVSVAMPDGKVKQLTMKEGVVDWPDGIPVHSSYKPSVEPEALREIRRKERLEQLRKEAAELGIELPALPVKNGHSDAVVDAEKALAEAQAAFDADPENAELKKAITVAKTALTKAKKAVGAE